MAFTYTAFVNNVAGMSISGVTRAYTAPPQQLNTADLPASFPRIGLVADSQSATLTQQQGLLIASVEIVVVMEPYQQSTNMANFAASVAMIDSIETAIVANASDYNIDRWNIILQIEDYGTKAGTWWQLVARIEGSGT